MAKVSLFIIVLAKSYLSRVFKKIQMQKSTLNKIGQYGLKTCYSILAEASFYFLCCLVLPLVHVNGDYLYNSITWYQQENSLLLFAIFAGKQLEEGNLIPVV